MRAPDLQLAIHRPEPVSESLQTSGGIQANAAHAVIGDPQPEQTGYVDRLHDGVPRPTVLGHIGQ
jgi:hypothetical protein